MAKAQAREENLRNETDGASWPTRVDALQRKHQRHEYDSLKPLRWERKVEEVILANPEYQRMTDLVIDLLDLLKEGLAEGAYDVLLAHEEEASARQVRREQLLARAWYERGYLDAARGHVATVELD